MGKIPLGGGLIPKGAIAYAGTYAVGKSLEFYYRGQGSTPGSRGGPFIAKRWIAAANCRGGRPGALSRSHAIRGVQ